MYQITAPELSAALSNNLGALVCWELSDSAITPDDLRSVLISHGEDASIVPDIDAASAASRAAREWGQGRGSDTRYKAEIVLREAGRVEAGILERRRISANEVQWVQIDAVVIEHDAQGVYTGSYTLGGTEQAGAYRGLFLKRLSHLDADWIRPHLIQSRLDAVGAFNLRRQGGVLFVDRTHLEEVERLARIVRSIGSSSFDIVHVAATSESRTSVARAANSYLEEQINEVVTKLDEWADKARAPRSDAVENLIEQVGDLVLRGGLYADVLQVTMTGIQERLDAVKSRAMTLLIDGVEDAA